MKGNVDAPELLRGVESSTRNESDADKEIMFVIVKSTWYWDVVYRKDTKVVSSSGRNFGNFTLLVNPDGSPMLWEGDSDD